MLSSLADLMEDNESLPGTGGGGDPKTTRGTHGAAAMSPKHELINGLKTLETEFHGHLGSEWFAVSSSTTSSSDRTGMGSATTSWATNTEATSSTGSVLGMAAGELSTASCQSQPASNCLPGMAAHMAEICDKLDKLERRELLTYAARITILVGNFYRMAREGDAAHSPAGSAGGGSVVAAANAHQLQHPWRPGSSNSNASQQALIDLVQHGSRPLSSMTIMSDMPLAFSASTASLAGLPAVQDSHHVHVDGDIDDGTKTINDYVIVAPIGAGSFGTVELGVTLAGEPRAIKAIKRSALMGRNEAAVRREIAIMKKLRHDNVVRLYEVIDDPGENMIYLVMKYCSNGPIVKVRPDFTCDTLPLPVAKALLRQLVSGLHYLHLRRVVHRDIKPDNVLLDHANCPCFVDFGVSGTVHKKSRTAINEKSTEGTPAFWAPEIFARKRHNEVQYNNRNNSNSGAPAAAAAGGNNSNRRAGRSDASPASSAAAAPAPLPPVDLMAADVYSLGATFFTAVCGVVPFVAKTQDALAELVLHSELRLPDFLPPAWKDLFARMLEKDPVKRIKLPAVKLHPVFTEDGADPGSPKDDIAVSDKELDDSLKPIRRDPLPRTAIGDSDPDVFRDSEDGGGGPTTPREPRFGMSSSAAVSVSTANAFSASSGQQASSKAMFHRKLPPVRKVAASGSPVKPSVAASASSPNAFADIVGGSGGGAGGIPPLPRSMSTSRMPLRNIVRASDLGGSVGSNSGSNALPPVAAAATARARPASSGR